MMNFFSFFSSETLRFYKALSQIGTDFTLMSQVFTRFTRNELKVSFLFLLFLIVFFQKHSYVFVSRKHWNHLMVKASLVRHTCKFLVWIWIFHHILSPPFQCFSLVRFPFGIQNKREPSKLTDGHKDNVFLTTLEKVQTRGKSQLWSDWYGFV